MASKEPNEQNRQKPHKFTNVIPAFDVAMRKIAATPKTEVDRREQAERNAKESSK